MLKFVKKHFVFFLVLAFVLFGLCGYFFFKGKEKESTPKTEATMLLIEFEEMGGLENMVNQMHTRDIPGVLMVSVEFLDEHCEEIKALQDYDIEIAGSAPGAPFWDVGYDEQREIMIKTKEGIEACTGKKMRIFSSKYFAYTEDTIKIAEELGIEYVFARGTTQARATIYKPTEYDVKIFSVSNVGSKNWGTGSLCDFSYWAREGTAADFRTELLNAIEEHPYISPVSHAYLGGNRVDWNEVYLELFDNPDVKWVSFDDFYTDYDKRDYDDIPVNMEVQYENVEYTEEECNPNDPDNICQ